MVEVRLSRWEAMACLLALAVPRVVGHKEAQAEMQPHPEMMHKSMLVT